MEDRTTISSSRLASSDVARATFSPVRRGFDPREVRSFLEQVARELAAAERRIAELREHVADAERRALHPVLDEETLTSALGSRSAAVLKSAHEEAQHVVTAAQARATELLGEAQDRAASVIVGAQRHAAATVAEAEHAAAALETEARATAERLADTARSNGDALVDRAREQGRTIVDEAQETRRKILADLLVRRKTLHVQIEQLRAARDSLTASVQSLRTTVDATLGDLEGSDERAKQAAIERLRAKPTPPPMGEEALDRPASEHPSGGAPPGGAEDPDAVEEIFAKLRKATLEERGAEAAAHGPTRTPVRPDTPVSAILQRRDEVVARSRDALVRKVKRSLQDDQNAALERVRGAEGAAVAERLGAEREQRDRYALASVEPLRDAANAGRSFAANEGGVVGPELADGALAELAEDLAATLVTALRKRMSNDNGKDGTDRVTAAYRDWRGARTERLCADLSLRAFHAGVAAASSGHQVRFVIAPAEPSCEQCGAVGASYQHGADPGTVRLPPLHAGCRCTVLPA
ncbi:MAG TPA: DivIVA domain-containing protein [Acidimicrobiales bacterium]|nr:DivIVA domain-containing protein [Acidimicrobiales bacterium]